MDILFPNYLLQVQNVLESQVRLFTGARAGENV